MVAEAGLAAMAAPLDELSSGTPDAGKKAVAPVTATATAMANHPRGRRNPGKARRAGGAAREKRPCAQGSGDYASLAQHIAKNERGKSERGRAEIYRKASIALTT